MNDKNNIILNKHKEKIHGYICGKLDSNSFDSATALQELENSVKLFDIRGGKLRGGAYLIGDLIGAMIPFYFFLDDNGELKEGDNYPWLSHPNYEEIKIFISNVLRDSYLHDFEDIYSQGRGRIIEEFSEKMIAPLLPPRYFDYIAALIGTQEAFDVFLQQGKSITINDDFLYYCISPRIDQRLINHNKQEIVSQIIQHEGFNTEVLNYQDNKGCTPLYLACKLEEISIIKKLLACPSINVNTQTKGTGDSPLTAAIALKKWDVALLLLEDPRVDVSLVKKNKEKSTAFSLIQTAFNKLNTKNELTDDDEKILKIKAKINKKIKLSLEEHSRILDEDMKNKVFFYYILKYDPELFVEYSLSVSNQAVQLRSQALNFKGLNNETPLHLLCQNLEGQSSQLACELPILWHEEENKKIGLNAKTRKPEKTPLISAILAKNWEVVEWLLGESFLLIENTKDYSPLNLMSMAVKDQQNLAIKPKLENILKTMINKAGVADLSSSDGISQSIERA